MCVCVFKLESTVCAQQRVLQILKNYNPPHPPQVFFFFSFFHLLILHTLPKPALALHWGAREEREKKTGAGDFFFTLNAVPNL